MVQTRYSTIHSVNCCIVLRRSLVAHRRRVPSALGYYRNPSLRCVYVRVIVCVMLCDESIVSEGENIRRDFNLVEQVDK